MSGSDDDLRSAGGLCRSCCCGSRSTTLAPKVSSCSSFSLSLSRFCLGACRLARVGRKGWTAVSGACLGSSEACPNLGQPPGSSVCASMGFLQSGAECFNRNCPDPEESGCTKLGFASALLREGENLVGCGCSDSSSSLPDDGSAASSSPRRAAAAGVRVVKMAIDAVSVPELLPHLLPASSASCKSKHCLL